MATATKSKTEALEVRRIFKAPQRRVFEAWTRPDDLKQWAAPGPMSTPLAQVDLRVGGAYRIHMRSPDGSEHRVHGIYREVDPPRKLVYTWSWETDPDVQDSLVTVEFHDRGDSTEIVLRHEGFLTAAKRDRHSEGWAACLEKFGTIV